MGRADQPDARQGVVPERARHREHPTQSIIQNDPAAGLNTLVFLLVVTLIVDAHSLGSAALGQDGARVSHVGDVEHVLGAFFTDEGDTGC